MSGFNEFYEEMQGKINVLARGGRFTMSAATFRKYMKMAYEKGVASTPKANALDNGMFDKIFGRG
jgi:hypothetical protein